MSLESLNNKFKSVLGKELSSNDFTDDEKVKVGKIVTNSPVVGKNLFNKDAVQLDKYINPASGDILTLTGGKISAPIAVSPLTRYTLSGHKIPAPGYNLAIRYESANGSKLSYLAISSNTSISFVTPANCVSLLISLYRPDFPQDFSLVQLEIGGTANSFKSYTATEPTFLNGIELFRPIKTSEPRRNLFDKSKITTGIAINTSTGELVSGANYAISDFIPIRPDVQYYLSGRTSGSYGLAFYDTSKTLLSSNNGYTLGSATGSFTPFSGARYVRFTVKDSNGVGSLDIQLEEGSAATAYESYSTVTYLSGFDGEKDVPGLFEKFTGVAFGDSITERDKGSDHNWVDIFDYVVKPYVISNRGYGGMRYAWKADTIESLTPTQDNNNRDNVLWNHIKKWEATSPATPDFFIIAAGTNDVSQASTIGTMSDAFAQDLASTSQLTMANAMRNAIQYLQTQYPKAQIFVTTPLQSKTGGRSWTALNNVSDVITDVAKRLNVKVIDCFNQSGIVDEYEGVGVAGRDLYDGTHPAASGALKQGKLIAHEFKKNFISF